MSSYAEDGSIGFLRNTGNYDVHGTMCHKTNLIAHSLGNLKS
jgi:hypothetical protein